MTEEEIHNICEKYKIENYKINPDMSIDVDGKVNLYKDQFSSNVLPLKFGRVTEYFNCDKTNITSLEGCPYYVGDSFECEKNNLTSLKGMPKHIETDFYCGGNKIPPIEFRWIFYSYIGGTIVTGTGYLTDFLNQHKNPSKKDLPWILSEFRKLY